MSSEELGEQLIKIQARLARILYPKYPKILGKGSETYGIVSWEVMDVIEGNPQINKYNCVTIKGDYNSEIIPNKIYNILAREVTDPNWGLQYNLIYWNEEVDLNTVNNQKTFLAQIITQDQITEMFKVFDNPIEVIARHDEKELQRVKGIGPVYAKKIIRTYEEKKDLSVIYLELDKVGLTASMISRLMRTYQEPMAIVKVINDNPYRLVDDVEGVGFKTADNIALKAGMSPKSVKRIQSFIKYYLNEQGALGHSYITAGELTSAIFNALGDKDEIIEEYHDELGEKIGNNISKVIDNLVKEKIIGLEDSNNKSMRRVYLMKYYNLEREISKHIKRLLSSPNYFVYNDWEEKVKELEKKQGFDFTQEQKDGIKLGLDSQVCLITGLAGCVDCDTEFFDGKGWKKISEYKEGDKVLQFNWDKDSKVGGAELVLPQEYIKLPCTQMWCTESKDFSMMVSDEHRVVYFDAENNLCETNMFNIYGYQTSSKYGWNCYIKTANYDKNKDIWDFKNVKFNIIGTKTKIEKVPTKDGYKYCFSVPSSYLVLRRNNKIFVTGNSGKSSLVSGILASLSSYSFAQCALSGKAAARLQEVTGQEGMTIHRLLGFQGGQFIHKEDSKLPYNIIVLDELSMVNGEIFLSLIQAIDNGAKLIMLGDPGQLESLGSLNLITDLLNSTLIPNVKLTKVHRQALKSGILTSSYDVRNNVQLFDEVDYEGREVRGELEDMLFDISMKKNKIKDDVITYFEKYYNSQLINKNIMELQIIVPIKTRGEACVEKLNLAIQNLINPVDENSDKPKHLIIRRKGANGEERSYYIQKDDKIMCIKNNYHVFNIRGQEVAIYNGWTGIVDNIANGFIYLKFPLLDELVIMDEDDIADYLILGYASTVHKCVTGGTWITVQDEENIIKNIQIRDFEPEWIGKYKVWNGKYFEMPDKFYVNQPMNTITIETEKGYKLSGLYDHRIPVNTFYDTEEELELNNIGYGDRVKIEIKNKQFIEDIVVHTEEGKVESTYCFNMPETHTFVANGILSSNCQGSGFQVVIGAIDYSTPPQMLTCQLVYTLLTRAKKECVLVAQTGALRQAIQTNFVSDKRTFLPEFLDKVEEELKKNPVVRPGHYDPLESTNPMGTQISLTSGKEIQNRTNPDEINLDEIDISEDNVSEDSINENGDEDIND